LLQSESDVVPSNAARRVDIPATFHFEMSPLNSEAPLKALAASVTRATFQRDRSWLNAFAFLNDSAISVVLATFHREMSALNSLRALNTWFMDLRADVSQSAIGP